MKIGPAIAGVCIFALAAYFYIESRSQSPSEPLRGSRTSDVKPRPDEVDLPASAGCQDGRIVITNAGAEPWLSAKIEVNGTYTYTADAIPGGAPLRFVPNGFTKSDGTRLDLDAVACKTIDIHATVNGQRRHWNGSYK